MSFGERQNRAYRLEVALCHYLWSVGKREVRQYSFCDPQGKDWRTQRDYPCEVFALLLHFPAQKLTYAKRVYDWPEFYDVVFLSDPPVPKGIPLDAESQVADLIESLNNESHVNPRPDRWELKRLAPD